MLVSGMALFLSFAGYLTAAPSATPERRDLTAIKAEQAALTPAQVLADLQHGNERFASGKTKPRDMLHDQQTTAAGQYPHAVILSCIDSRAPAELIFDAGLGDLFNARSPATSPIRISSEAWSSPARSQARNLCSSWATRVAAQSKARATKVELGNLTGLLEKIQPAVAAVQDVQGERNSKNTAFVEAVSEANVRLTVERIRELSPILREMESTGENSDRGLRL